MMPKHSLGLEEHEFVDKVLRPRARSVSRKTLCNLVSGLARDPTLWQGKPPTAAKIVEKARQRRAKTKTR